MWCVSAGLGLPPESLARVQLEEGDGLRTPPLRSGSEARGEDGPTAALCTQTRPPPALRAPGLSDAPASAQRPCPGPWHSATRPPSITARPPQRPSNLERRHSWRERPSLYPRYPFSSYRARCEVVVGAPGPHNLTDEPGRPCVGGLLPSFRLVYSENNTTDKGDSPQFVPMAGDAILPRVKPHIPDQISSKSAAPSQQMVGMIHYDPRSSKVQWLAVHRVTSRPSGAGARQVAHECCY